MTKKDEKNGKMEKNPEEDLVLRKGAYVQITSGSNRDLYGEVDGMDDEAARVFVRMAVGGKVVSVSENAVKVVGKKEYKKYSKVINKDMYEEYKVKQESRQEEWDKGRSERDRNGSSSKRRSRSRSRSPEKKKSKYRDEDYEERKVDYRWVRPYLKVRFIDERYKKGRYYKEKVIVDDVVALNNVTVRTDSGRVLEEIHPKQLETIVPKGDFGIVMIVSGSSRGKLGEILRRDKSKCVAAVQLLPDKDEVLKLDFDDICEYVGEIPDY